MTSHLVVFLAVLVSIPGCAHNQTNPPEPSRSSRTGAAESVGWDARVGHFTLDQAISELGVPPERSTLPSGGTICRWFSFRPRQVSAAEAAHDYAIFHDPPHSNPLDRDTLILTFDARSVLVRWVYSTE